MLRKKRIFLTIGFILSFSWDLILKINADLSFLSGASDYSYLGDIRVPGSLLFSGWILELIIIVLGSYAILTVQPKIKIPSFILKPKEIPTTFECHNCGNKYPQLAKSINLKKETMDLFCPGCGVTIKTETIVITSTKPFTYDIRKV
jgi:predicted RNA-binding Zn-ribbon protein involved in translation (DUF1610 family)